MSLEDEAQKLAALLEEKRGIGGRGLEAKLRRAGRTLPRWVRRDVQALLSAAALEAHPKLGRRIDHGRVTLGSRNVANWLAEQDPWERKRKWMLGFAAANAFNILVVFVLVVGVLVWRGFL